ncbi:MAG: PEGA domain-containing protein [Deltaproteobacteria bacterium]|nr:PEGA domain-containing protein [Deltaproteobacteria bacterium]
MPARPSSLPSVPWLLGLVMPLVTAGALAAPPRPGGMESIPVPGAPDSEYLVDRARNLCFFKSGGAVTPVDCERVLGAGKTAPPTTPTPTAKKHDFGRGATLEIHARPWGKVTIDGVAAGATPLIQAVAPGEHTVVVTQDTQRVERKVKLRRNETWVLSMDPGERGPALMAAWRTAPPPTLRDLGKGARVILLAWPSARYFIDGVEVGRSPLIMDIGPGVHVITARRIEGEDGAPAKGRAPAKGATQPPELQGSVHVDIAAGDELRVDARDLGKDRLDVERLQR